MKIVNYNHTTDSFHLITDIVLPWTFLREHNSTITFSFINLIISTRSNARGYSKTDDVWQLHKDNSKTVL